MRDDGTDDVISLECRCHRCIRRARPGMQYIRLSPTFYFITPHLFSMSVTKIVGKTFIAVPPFKFLLQRCWCIVQLVLSVTLSQ